MKLRKKYPKKNAEHYSKKNVSEKIAAEEKVVKKASEFGTERLAAQEELAQLPAEIKAKIIQTEMEAERVEAKGKASRKAIEVEDEISVVEEVHKAEEELRKVAKVQFGQFEAEGIFVEENTSKIQSDNK